MTKQKKIMIIFIIVGAIIAIITLIGAAFLVTSVGNIKKADFFELGGDQVPTVKLVVGERKIASFSSSIENGITTKTYEYRSDSSAADMEQYIKYLREDEDFIVTSVNDNKNDVYYGKNSVEEGRIILVYIDANPFGYTIKLIKGRGELNKFN